MRYSVKFALALLPCYLAVTLVREYHRTPSGPTRQWDGPSWRKNRRRGEKSNLFSADSPDETSPRLRESRAAQAAAKGLTWVLGILEGTERWANEQRNASVSFFLRMGG